MALCQTQEIRRFARDDVLTILYGAACMLIKRYQLSDAEIEALDSLLETVKQHDGGLPAIYKHLLILRRDTPCHFLFYTANTPGKLIGFLSFYFFYQDSCEISLVVHPDHRHQGIAHQLLKTLYSTYLTPQIKSLYFSSSTAKTDDWQHHHSMFLSHTEYHLKRTLPKLKAPSHPKLSIRPATLADIPTLCLLDDACFHDQDDGMPERFQLLITDSAYTVLVAEREGQLIGKAHLRYDTIEATLSDLAILPDHQHQGLGGELLAYTINYAIDQGFETIELDVKTNQQPILNLYLQHGFSIDTQLYFYKKTL
ncbi:MAG: GNAT family N-acetyltransferase [Gammaproteobacteria bacterium]|nr:GNAT family N-acetyltransferase [Gammaproteobacteria bacterium]